MKKRQRHCNGCNAKGINGSLCPDCRDMLIMASDLRGLWRNLRPDGWDAHLERLSDRASRREPLFEEIYRESSRSAH